MFTRTRFNRPGTTAKRLLAGSALNLLVAVFWLGWKGSTGYAASPQYPGSTTTPQHGALLERGRIVGWPGGKAVIYPTVGFFGLAQIFAVGAVHSDGSFLVRFPAVLPPDLLNKSTDQCATLRSSDPSARNNFTGNYLIVQHGAPVGATHSATSPAFASFTGGANGDTRTGFLYTDRDTTLSGYCQRSIHLGGYAVDFRQNFDLPVHRGWNEVVARLSIPQPGHLIADLKVGSNSAREKWFFFHSAPQPQVRHA